MKYECVCNDYWLMIMKVILMYVIIMCVLILLLMIYY